MGADILQAFFLKNFQLLKFSSRKQAGTEESHQHKSQILYQSIERGFQNL